MIVQKPTLLKLFIAGIILLACVVIGLVITSFEAAEKEDNPADYYKSNRLSDDNNDSLDDLPPIPEVIRTTDEIAIAEVQNITYGGVEQNLQFYRNSAYDCGLTGSYTFLVANPVDGNAHDEAPLWVYLHGGGVGYWNDDGDYIGVNKQTEDTWNHEETFEDLIQVITARVLDKNKGLEDNTLTRRGREGYRLLVVSMCDHDLYTGTGNSYPNHPLDPNATVNGLQATMAAIDFVTSSYPTTHVFVHGTSAGSIGAYAVSMTYASEDIGLTGIVSDTIFGPRKLFINERLAGEPGFPNQSGYTNADVDEKLGPWADPDNRLFPEDRFGAGFHRTPTLMIGGLKDPFCGGLHDSIPEAKSDGFDNNCAWLAEPLQQIAALPDNSLSVVVMEGEGHVPTIDPGPANDAVDTFLKDILEKNPDYPFRG